MASAPKPMDAVVKNAMRYSLSPREYELLHRYLLRKTRLLNHSIPHPATFEKAVQADDDYNAHTVRLSVRLLCSSFVALKLWEDIVPGLVAATRRHQTAPKQPKPTPFLQKTSTRLSSSITCIFLFHRLLHRFLRRLAVSLRHDHATPFAKRNPRIHKLLVSKLAPIIGSGLAGLFLAVYPATQLRLTITIYMFTRSLEFLFNHAEPRLDFFKRRPWWFGSWLLMPAACGQLAHALVFDRDCFPAAYQSFLLTNSTTYLQPKPPFLPSNTDWPSDTKIIDTLGKVSKLSWPKFISPIMFPQTQTLPSSCLSVSNLTSTAHPALRNLSCAILHPNDPSCLRTYCKFFLQSFPAILRHFSLLLGAFSLLRIQSFLKQPVPSLVALAKSILRTSLFVTGALGSTWGSICFFQHFLPKRLLSTQRWFLGGAIAGMWAFLDRKSGRGNFIFTTRLILDSLWKVSVKRGWWKGFRYGDVLLFTASLIAMQTVYERNPSAVDSPVIRKCLSLISGDGFIDRAATTQSEKDDNKKD